MSYFDDRRGMQLLRAAYAAGASIERPWGFASSTRNWTEFKEGLEILDTTAAAELASMDKQLREPVPQVLRGLAQGGIGTIGESVAIVAATKGLAAPSEKAAEVLQQAVRYDELLLTIDFDRYVYYFGRSRDGGGRTYHIEQPRTVRELADAIKDDFEFLPSPRSDQHWRRFAGIPYRRGVELVASAILVLEILSQGG